MSYIDYLIVSSYLLIIFIVGIRIKSTNSIAQYIFVGRKLTTSAFVFTLVTTWYGGILEIGRFSYINGLSTWVIFGLFYYIAAIFYAQLFVPKIISSKFQSIPDAIENRYNKNAAILASLIIFLLSSPAPYLLIISQIFSYLFGIDMLITMVVCGSISILYTTKSGFASVIKTDIIQFILMFGGFLFVFVFLVINYGGLEFIRDNVPHNKLTLKGDFKWSYILSWFFIAMITFIDPNFYQRSFAGLLLKKVKKGIYISIAFWFVFDFLSISLGIYALAILPNLSNSSPYLELSVMILPNIIRGLFIVSLLSVVMSTIDSYALISGFTFGQDIVPRLFNVKEHIIYIKLGIVLTFVISLVICNFFISAVDIWYIFGSISVASILIPFIGALWNQNLYSPSLIILLPALLTIIWFLYGIESIDPMYPGLSLSLILFLIFKDRKVV